jgi:flavin-dependent dehydrogenase
VKTRSGRSSSKSPTSRKTRLIKELGSRRRPQVGGTASSCRTIAGWLCFSHIFGIDWVSVGDSASSYGPLSSRGIFKALHHGEAVARAVDSTMQGDAGAMERYASQICREFEAYRQQRHRLYCSESQLG